MLGALVGAVEENANSPLDDKGSLGATSQVQPCLILGDDDIVEETTSSTIVVANEEGVSNIRLDPESDTNDSNHGAENHFEEADHNSLDTVHDATVDKTTDTNISTSDLVAEQEMNNDNLEAKGMNTN